MRAAGVRGEHLAPRLSHTKLLNISHWFRSGTEPTKFRLSATVTRRCFRRARGACLGV